MTTGCSVSLRKRLSGSVEGSAMIAEAYLKHAKMLAKNSPLMQSALDVISSGQRKTCTDQNLQSMLRLLALGAGFCEQHPKSKIVEVGTGYGASTSVWTRLTDYYKVDAYTMDLSTAPWMRIRGKLAQIGLKTRRVVSYSANAVTLDWKHVLGDGIPTLLYIDAHDSAKYSVMDSIINRAFPLLNKDTDLVVIHDFFFRGTDEYRFKHTFMPPHVNLKKLVKFPHHKGEIIGFREVPVLMKWLKEKRLNIHYTDSELRRGKVLQKLKKRGFTGSWLPQITGQDSWSSLMYFGLK